MSWIRQEAFALLLSVRSLLDRGVTASSQSGLSSDNA